MLENDWLFRQIEVMSRAISVALLGRDTVTNIMREETENKEGLVIDEETLLSIMLRRYLLEGNINKAEDILFENIEKNKSEGLLNIALDFYERLAGLGDDYLREHNFSCQEVLEGMSDVQKLFNIKNYSYKDGGK